MRDPALAYNGLSLDRGVGRRADPAWIGRVRAHPGSRAVLLWRDKCLVDPAGPMVVPVADLAGEPVLLGLDGDAGVFAADLSALDETVAVAVAGAATALDVRRLFGTIDPRTAALLAYARGILYWHPLSRERCTGQGPRLLRAWLRAERIRHLVVLRAHRLAPGLLAQARGPRRCRRGRALAGLAPPRHSPAASAARRVGSRG